MQSAPVAERLITARSEMKRACDLLIASTPESLDHCQTVLRRAVNELTAIQGRRDEVHDDLAQALRSEVLQAARLLQSLALFYQGWERILGAITIGYTSSGDPAAVVRQGRLCWRG